MYFIKTIQVENLHFGSFGFGAFCCFPHQGAGIHVDTGAGVDYYDFFHVILLLKALLQTIQQALCQSAPDEPSPGHWDSQDQASLQGSYIPEGQMYLPQSWSRSL